MTIDFKNLHVREAKCLGGFAGTVSPPKVATSKAESQAAFASLGQTTASLRSATYKFLNIKLLNIKI